MLKPWMLPLIVLAIAVPVVFAFVVGGPGLGVAVGALVAVAITVIAIRARPEEPIEVARRGDGPRRILVVLSVPVDEPAAVEEIAREVGMDNDGADAEVVVLAPARSSFLDRWASDVRKSREVAQRDLVITIASLAKADVDAQASVGDADLVQATEDRLRDFPADEVILTTGTPERDPDGVAAAEQLRERLPIPFRRVVI
jgi:hypothetical protein